MLSRSGLIRYFLRWNVNKEGEHSCSPLSVGVGRSAWQVYPPLQFIKKWPFPTLKMKLIFSKPNNMIFGKKNPNKDSFADKFLTGASDPSPNIKEKSIFCSSTLPCLCSRWLIYILTNRFARKPDSKEKPFMCLPDIHWTMFIPLAALSDYFDAGRWSQTLKSAI